MATYDLTLGPGGAHYIATADLPVGITATSSFILAALVTNGKLLDDLIVAGGPPHTLGSHSDVTLTALATNDILVWNGTAWVNSAGVPADIYVNAGSFNAATMQLTLQDTNGSTADVVIPLAHPINSLTDVDTVTVAPIAGDTMRFDGTNWTPFRPEIAFGRINSTQDVRGPAATQVNMASMTGVVGRNNGAFVAGGYTVTQGGTYRVRVQLAWDTTNTAYSNDLRISVNGVAQAAKGSSSLTRATAADNFGGNYVEDVVTVAAGAVLGAQSLQDSGNNNAVNLVANASTIFVERLNV